jgi:hypothetical protein
MPDHDAIQRRAYELYEQRGRENGHDCDDWLQAERELARTEDAVDQEITHGSLVPPARRRRDKEGRVGTASA